MSKINIGWSPSSLDVFVSCPQKHLIRYGMQREAVQKAEPLDRGDLFHASNEAYYKALKEKKDFEECVNAGVMAMNVRGAAESDLEPKQISYLVSVFEQYALRWRQVDRNLEILVVEQPFSYVLYEDDTFRIIMSGKIDLLVNDPPNYYNLPYDHKSYSRDFPVHRKTNQFCSYAYALKSNYLIVNRIGLQTSIPPEKKHKRIPLSYDPIFLEQWRQNVIKWSMFYWDCVQENSWPLNDTSCDKYNRLCEYYEICDTSGDNNKIYKLETNFKKSKKHELFPKEEVLSE